MIRLLWMRCIAKLFSELSDSWFEMLNIVYCMAIWLMKHAAFCAAKDEVRDSEAKECLTCLRRAAGMFGFIKDSIGNSFCK